MPLVSIIIIIIIMATFRTHWIYQMDKSGGARCGVTNTFTPCATLRIPGTVVRDHLVQSVEFIIDPQCKISARTHHPWRIIIYYVCIQD